MLGQDRVHQITRRVLQLSAADQTEVLVFATTSSLTRFANSAIHQNVNEQNAQVRVRAVVDKRIGVATTNRLDDDSLARVAARALEIARLQPQNPDFYSLPEPHPIPAADTFVPATAEWTPEQRADAVATICALARRDSLTASGAMSTQAGEIAVANSLGVFAYAPTTTAELSAVLMSDDSSGYAAASSADVRTIDAAALGEEAAFKARASTHPQALPPGDYPVVLEAYAVADLISYLSYLGFGALAVQEGRSFMTGHMGEQITGSCISIWDDGLDPSGLPMPFDFEGVPKERVDLIANGIANAVVYDSYTAKREGKESTGHALPAPNTFGPLPVNLFVGPGHSSREEMLAALDGGLWITRFHYVNPVHPLRTILTGMTRDGTFWVENGQIKHAVRNLRFTQSVLDALATAQAISADTRLVAGILGGVRAPALFLSRFSFTGATEF